MSSKNNNTRNIITVLSLIGLLAAWIVCFVLFPDKTTRWMPWLFTITALLACYRLVGVVLLAAMRKDAYESDASKMKNLVNAEKENKKKKLPNSYMQILRYATTLLAVLSFYTTAQGMKDFVFSGDSVLAYLASFAIQSILLVFSLLLIQFVISVREADWPEALRMIIVRGAIFFFCISLMASSIFSWVYISTHAYASTRYNDGEMQIRQFLETETVPLREENERRGKILFDQLLRSLSGTGANGEGTIKDLVDKSQEKYLTQIKGIQEEIPERSQPGLFDDENAEIHIRNALKGSNVKTNVIETCVVAAKSVYANACTQYEKRFDGILKEIKNLDWQDLENARDRVSANIDLCGAVIQALEEQLTQIDVNVLVGDGLRLDGSVVKPILKEPVNTAISDIELTRSKLEQVRALLEKMSSAEAPDDASSGAGEKVTLDTIIKELYLLPAKADDQKAENVQRLAEDLSAVMNDAADKLNVTDLSGISIVLEQLQNYAEYLELHDDIQSFVQTDLKKTYSVTAPLDREGDEEVPDQYTEAPTEDGASSEDGQAPQNVRTVTPEEWRSIRSEDMLAFVSFVSSLPAVPGDQDKNYELEKTLREATALQRRCLGELTDLEQAINYLSSDYPVMSYFSAALAIFLDLTAFLIGCLMYFSGALGIGYEEKKKENETNGDTPADAAQDEPDSSLLENAAQVHRK